MQGGQYLSDGPVTFTPDQRVAAESSASVSVFRHAGPLAGMSPGQLELDLFNAGPDNDRLQLSYASMGRLLFDLPSLGGQILHEVRPFAFGFPTAVAGVPVSETVTYTGLVMARGVSGLGGVISPRYHRYAINGTVQLAFDYSARHLTGTLILTATDVTQGNAGPTYQLGSFAVSGSPPSGSANWTATITNESLSGFIAGPAGQEAAGTFSLNLVDPANGDPLPIVGSFASRQ